MWRRVGPPPAAVVVLAREITTVCVTAAVRHKGRQRPSGLHEQCFHVGLEAYELHAVGKGEHTSRAVALDGQLPSTVSSLPADLQPFALALKCPGDIDLDAVFRWLSHDTRSIGRSPSLLTRRCRWLHIAARGCTEGCDCSSPVVIRHLKHQRLYFGRERSGPQTTRRSALGQDRQ